MTTIRIVIVVALMAGSGGALNFPRAEQAVNPPANLNPEEQSNMTNEKVIMLIEAKIQPQRRAEIVEAVRQYLPLVRAERASRRFTSRHEKTIPIRSFSTRFTGRKQLRTSICSRTSLRSSLRR
jgi:hypothetical protein